MNSILNKQDKKKEEKKSLEWITWKNEFKQKYHQRKKKEKKKVNRYTLKIMIFTKDM